MRLDGGWRRSGFWLSPINRRRWANFKANRRGYWSLIVFLSLFVLSLFAEFLANDRPIVMTTRARCSCPVLVDYPESKFGGFLAVTDYKDPVILEEIGENGWAIWPPIGYSYDTINKDYPGARVSRACASATPRRRPGPRALRCATPRPSSSRASTPSATTTGSASTIRAATWLRA